MFSRRHTLIHFGEYLRQYAWGQKLMTETHGRGNFQNHFSEDTPEPAENFSIIKKEVLTNNRASDSPVVIFSPL